MNVTGMKDTPWQNGSPSHREMVRWRRLSLALTAVLLGIAGLASCGGTGSNSSSPATGGGSGQPQLSTSPGSISFGNVVMGSTTSQPITITNIGNASLSISQVTIAGSGFSITSAPTPITLAVGQTTTATVTFTPQAPGSVTGNISLLSNAPTSPVTVPLSGTALAATSQVSASPTSLSLGNVALQSNGTKTFTLTNVGNSSVSITQISVSGTGFSTSGPAPPLTLSSGQSTNVSVIFAPPSYGSFTGSVSVESGATNSPALVSLSGSSHAEILTWNASTSTVVGYNVYRGTQSGGPYGTKVNSSLIPSTTFTDASVQPGQTLFYVVTAVNSSGVESGYSDQMSATVASP